MLQRLKHPCSAFLCCTQAHSLECLGFRTSQHNDIKDPTPPMHSPPTSSALAAALAVTPFRMSTQGTPQGGGALKGPDATRPP